MRLKALVSNPTDKINDPDRPFIALEHLESGTGRVLSGVELEGKDADDSVAHEAGDVRFGKLRPYLAKSFLAEAPGAGSGELLVLRPGPKILSRYLWYITLSQPFVDWAVATSYGVKMPRTSWDAIGAFEIDPPALDDQRRIVEVLDSETARIDELAAEQQRLLELLGERWAVEQDRVFLPMADGSTRCVPTDVPVPSEVPERWRIAPLGHLLERITYGFTNPMPTTDEGPWMLTAADILDGEISWESARHTSADAYTALTDKSRPKQGDVLITKDGTLGRVAVCPGGDICINQSVALLRPRIEAIEGPFLARLLQAPTYRDALVFEAGGTTIKHLYITRMVKQSIAFPPSRIEREGLLATLDERGRTLSDLLSASRGQLSLLREHRQALITAAVTGGLDALRKVA